MELVATSPRGTTLPLAWRLRRATLVALLLGLWAPVKLAWELRIAHEQEMLRYHGVAVTLELRDQLSQGLTIGVLGGMRSAVADFLWLEVTSAWMNQDWWKMGGLINACTALQPRAPVFWDMGGWQLAWNASLAARRDPTQPNELRRIKAERFWIDRGLEIFKRGIENNPDYWRLWRDTALLYQQRLGDYDSAAYYYQKASEQPDAPVYLERAPAEMYSHGFKNDPQSEYVEWVKLWKRLTPEEKMVKLHTADRIEREIRRLEQQLSVPKEKRIFPN
jgi:tetratricopeptide (TPR) repeat protein